jgi:hypothetical protein
MAHGIVRSPKYPAEEAEYEVEVSEIYCALEINYDNDTPTNKDSTIVSDTYTPNWNSPPDIFNRLVFPGEDEVLDNSWTRSGMTFANSGDTISDVDKIWYDVALNGFQSAQSYKVHNPMPHSMLVEVWSMDGSYVEQTLHSLVAIPPARSRELPLVGIAKKIDDDGDPVLCIRSFLYNEDISDNYINIDATNDNFTIPIGDVDPRTGVKIGVSCFFNMYNKLDRYGLIVAALGGGGLAALQQTTLLADRPEVQRAAATAGIEISELAGIVALGISENWITWSDALELLFPILAAGAGTAFASYAARSFSSPYAGVLGAVGTGVISAASATALMLVIDDAKIDCQA